MPSKLQYEINKLRGEVSKDDKISNDNIHLLREALISTEIAIKELQSVDNNINSSISNIKVIANKALYKSTYTIKTRYLWLDNPYWTTAGRELYGIAYHPDNEQSSAFGFSMPEGFVEVKNVYIYYKANTAANNVILDIETKFRTTDEDLSTHNETDFTNTITMVDQNMHRFVSSLTLNELKQGDNGYIRIRRKAALAGDTNTGNLMIIGILIKYRGYT